MVQVDPVEGLLQIAVSSLTRRPPAPTTRQQPTMNTVLVGSRLVFIIVRSFSLWLIIIIIVEQISFSADICFNTALQRHLAGPKLY